MGKDQKSADEAVEANNRINTILEDGKVHDPLSGRSETERANIELQNQFGEEKDEEHDINASPTAIVTPRS